MKPQVELDKARIRMLIQNYEKLPPLIIIIEDSYVWLYKILEVIVRTHRIPSIGTLTQTMRKKQATLQVDQYIEKLMHEANNDDLHLSIENMRKYIDGSTTLRTMLCIL